MSAWKRMRQSGKGFLPATPWQASSGVSQEHGEVCGSDVYVQSTPQHGRGGLHGQWDDRSSDRDYPRYFRLLVGTLQTRHHHFMGCCCWCGCGDPEEMGSVEAFYRWGVGQDVIDNGLRGAEGASREAALQRAPDDWCLGIQFNHAYGHYYNKENEEPTELFLVRFVVESQLHRIFVYQYFWEGGAFWVPFYFRSYSEPVGFQTIS